MTREEALNKIGELVVYARAQGWDYEYTEAFEMLKQEPCEDAISRQALKSQMIKYGFHAPDMTVTEFVEDLPSITPAQSVIEDIKAEFVSRYPKNFANEPEFGGRCCVFSLRTVLDVIDKHISEKENE